MSEAPDHAPDPVQESLPETPAQAAARETLDEHFAALDALMEADWIRQGSPVDEDGVKQFRPQAVVEAEAEAEG